MKSKSVTRADKVKVYFSEYIENLSSLNDNRLTWCVSVNDEQIDNARMNITVESVANTRLGGVETPPNPLRWDPSRFEMTIPAQYFRGYRFQFKTSLTIDGNPVDIDQDVDEVIIWNNTSPDIEQSPGAGGAFYYGKAQGAPKLATYPGDSSVYIAGENWLQSYDTLQIINKTYPNENIDTDWLESTEAHGRSEVSQNSGEWFKALANVLKISGEFTRPPVGLAEMNIWYEDMGNPEYISGKLTRQVQSMLIDGDFNVTIRQATQYIHSNSGPWFIPVEI
jgi:hypothetical protein